jgi:serine/threonine protein kinase
MVEGSASWPRVLPPEMFGEHTLLAKLGEGGMAVVYLAVRERGLGLSSGSGVRDAQVVALKRMLLPMHEARARSMFLDEVRIVSRLGHPCVARMIDAGETGGLAWIATEAVLGETFGRALSRVPKRARMAFAVRTIAQACEGLHAAHELVDEQGRALGVVHRDISPDNLMVGYDGFVRVLDFGVAHALDRLQRTATGELKGKIRYAAPEQIDGVEVDRRTDVWALGVVLWEALTGRLLFGQHKLKDVLMAVTTAPIPGVRELNPALPLALDEIVSTALARAPERRQASARELGRALDHFLAEQQSTCGVAELSELMSQCFQDERVEKTALVGEARRMLASK